MILVRFVGLVAKLADAPPLEGGSRKGVEVQVLSSSLFLLLEK